MKPTLQELTDRLKATGAYETPARIERSLAGRLFGWSDAWYRWQVFSIIWKASRLARRGVYDRQAWLGSSFALLGLVEEAGGRLDIGGVEHLAALKGPAVCVGNHMSLLETLLLPVFILPHRELRFVVKQSLLEYPVFGSVMRAIGAISVSREDPRNDLKTVLTEGAQCLERGDMVMIFPQATRSAVFEPAAFNTLGAKLAARAGVPVIPVAVKTDFLRNGRLIKDLGRLDRSRTVRFKFGAPIEAGGNAKDAHRAVVEFIRENLRSWGGQIRDGDEVT